MWFNVVELYSIATVLESKKPGINDERSTELRNQHCSSLSAALSLPHRP